MVWQSFWLWLYAGAMAIVVLHVWGLSRQPWGIPLSRYQLGQGMCLWSGLMAVIMALGEGKIELAGQVTYYARYLDWLVAGPLMLLSLSWTAMFGIARDRRLVLVLCSLGIILIFSSCLADLSISRARYLWYANAGVAFLSILKIIWGPLHSMTQIQGLRISNLYENLATYFTIVWLLYAIAWLVGPAGLGIIDPVTDILLFCGLSFFAQAGFCLVQIYGLRRLKQFRFRAINTY